MRARSRRTVRTCRTSWSGSTSCSRRSDRSYTTDWTGWALRNFDIKVKLWRTWFASYYNCSYHCCAVACNNNGSCLLRTRTLWALRAFWAFWALRSSWTLWALRTVRALRSSWTLRALWQYEIKLKLRGTGARLSYGYGNRSRLCRLRNGYGSGCVYLRARTFWTLRALRQHKVKVKLRRARVGFGYGYGNRSRLCRLRNGYGSGCVYLRARTFWTKRPFWPFWPLRSRWALRSVWALRSLQYFNFKIKLRRARVRFGYGYRAYGFLAVACHDN